MKLLVVYGSIEGQTKKICEFLGDEAEKAGHMVEVHNSIENPPAPGEYDAAIIGASLHAEKYQASVKHYVKEHQKALNTMPTAFISVSLTAAGNEPESWKELKKITRSFLDQTGWNPDYVEQVAGALRYSRYNFFKKFIMRMIAQRAGGDTDTSEDREYTDWNQVKSVIAKLEKFD